MTALRFGLAVSSSALGIVLGLFGTAGCVTDECSCEAFAIDEGRFRVIYVGSSSEDLTLFDASGSTITVGSDAVTVEYSRDDARVTARYRVTHKVPE